MLEGQLAVMGEVGPDGFSRQLGEGLVVLGAVGPYEVDAVVVADEGGVGQPAVGGGQGFG